jgi:hypothetical protein
MAPAPLPPANVAASGGLNWEAGVDAYYLYNFTGDPSIQGPIGRAFDQRSNSFTLNMAKLAAYVAADPVGFRIDVMYGNIGAIGNAVSLLAEPPAAMDPIGTQLYL